MKVRFLGKKERDVRHPNKPNGHTFENGDACEFEIFATRHCIIKTTTMRCSL